MMAIVSAVGLAVFYAGLLCCDLCFARTAYSYSL